MKRLIVVVLLGSGLLGVGTGVAVASPGEDPIKVCVVLWDDPNTSGRDGVCVVGPDRNW